MEENSMKGIPGMDEWCKLFEIFFYLIKNETITSVWIESGKYIENMVNQLYILLNNKL